jgi:hypothetical protein
MKTSSAGRLGALDNIFGDEPGTERQDRRGLVTWVVMGGTSFRILLVFLSR